MRPSMWFSLTTCRVYYAKELIIYDNNDDDDDDDDDEQPAECNTLKDCLKKHTLVLGFCDVWRW